MPSPIQTHRPPPITSNNPARDEGTPYVGPPRDVDTRIEPSSDIRSVSPPPLHRPKPINLTTPSRNDRFSRPPPNRQTEEPVNPRSEEHTSELQSHSDLV